ncbi:hypothetical protein [Absidia glauca]|uniref:Uncharacterized protein n=1 Tax=Absidia glauca TaxID=4829 RepID=A0A168MP32_ABSGL|nr:hypothetical protein [Absidia glauca]
MSSSSVASSAAYSPRPSSSCSSSSSSVTPVSRTRTRVSRRKKRKDQTLRSALPPCDCALLSRHQSASPPGLSQRRQNSQLLSDEEVVRPRRKHPRRLSHLISLLTLPTMKMKKVVRTKKNHPRRILSSDEDEVSAALPVESPLPDAENTHDDDDGFQFDFGDGEDYEVHQSGTQSSHSPVPDLLVQLPGSDGYELIVTKDRQRSVTLSSLDPLLCSRSPSRASSRSFGNYDTIDAWILSLCSPQPEAQNDRSDSAGDQSSESGESDGSISNESFSSNDNDDALDMETFYDMVMRIPNSHEYVQAALAGKLNNEDTNVFADDSAGAIKFYHDVDSIGIVSNSVPAHPNTGRVIINTTSTSDIDGVTTKNHIGFHLPGHIDDFAEVSDVPNYQFGRFGDLGRFTVCICFPEYTLPYQQENMARNGLKRVAPRDIGFFVNRILLPSIHQMYKNLDLPPRDAITPFSQRQEFLAHRTGNSHMSTSVNILEPGHWPHLEQCLRRTIRSHFLTQAIGIRRLNSRKRWFVSLTEVWFIYRPWKRVVCGGLRVESCSLFIPNCPYAVVSTPNSFLLRPARLWSFGRMT